MTVRTLPFTALACALACTEDPGGPTVGEPIAHARAQAGGASGTQRGEDPRASEREHMVETQIRARGVGNVRVLEAMRTVPRHVFVPARMRDSAYDDTPLPIGYGQTISQPFVVARMTELLGLEGNERVLEIGTGSGYQAAILSVLAREVYTIEIVEPLARSAARTLARLGYRNVHVRAGDGYQGWPEEAPFDAIVVTAAPPRVPEPLKQQLALGGRLIIPVGDYDQELKILERTEHGLSERAVLPVRFVPMTGTAQQR